MNKIKKFTFIRIPSEIKLLDSILSELYQNDSLTLTIGELEEKFINEPNRDEIKKMFDKRGNYSPNITDFTFKNKLLLSAIVFLRDKENIVIDDKITTTILYEGIHKFVNGGYILEYRNIKINSFLQKAFWWSAIGTLIFSVLNFFRLCPF